MRTRANRPISRCGPGKLTTRLFSVRPATSLASFLETPSTSTVSTVPTIASLMARALSLSRACMRCSRSFFSAMGVASGSWAAGVPGRLENTKLKDWSKPTCSMRSMVSSKSWRISPGKPTMKSDDITRSGRASRSRAARSRKSSRVWLRFISRRTLSEPLCTGRCRWPTSSGTSA